MAPGMDLAGWEGFGSSVGFETSGGFGNSNGEGFGITPTSTSTSAAATESGTSSDANKPKTVSWDDDLPF